MLIRAPLIIAKKLELQHSRPKRDFTVILSCFYSEHDVAEPGGTAWHRAAQGEHPGGYLSRRATPCGKKTEGKHPH